MADVNDKMIRDIASMIGESADDVIREHYSYSDDYKTGQQEFDFSGGPIKVDSDPFYFRDDQMRAVVYSINSADQLWDMCQPIDHVDDAGQRHGSRDHSIHCNSTEEAETIFKAYGRGGPMFFVEFEDLENANYEGKPILCSNDLETCYFDDGTDALKDPKLKSAFERLKAQMISSSSTRA